MRANALFTSSLGFRALTDDDLCSLLASRCAAQIGDIFDRCSVQTSDGTQFNESATAEIVDLLLNAAGTLMSEIVTLGTGLSSDKVERLPTFDRLITALQIVDKTFANSSLDELGQRVLLKLFASSAQTSAVASSNGVRH